MTRASRRTCQRRPTRFRRFSTAVRGASSVRRPCTARSSTAAPRRQHMGVHRVGLRLWPSAWAKQRTRPRDARFSEVVVSSSTDGGRLRPVQCLNFRPRFALRTSRTVCEVPPALGNKPLARRLPALLKSTEASLWGRLALQAACPGQDRDHRIDRTPMTLSFRSNHVIASATTALYAAALATMYAARVGDAASAARFAAPSRRARFGCDAR